MGLGTPVFAECISTLQRQGMSHAKAKRLCQMDINIASAVVSDTVSQKQSALLRDVQTSSTDFFSIQNVILLAIVARLSKTPEGLKVLRDIAVQGIKTMGDSMEALAKASVGNPVSAWANPYLLSILWEKWGIVGHERMAEFRIGLSVISGADVATDVLESLTTFLPFSGEKPSDFPSQIHFGDKTYEITPSLSMKLAPDKKKKG